MQLIRCILKKWDLYGHIVYAGGLLIIINSKGKVSGTSYRRIVGSCLGITGRMCFDIREGALRSLPGRIPRRGRICAIVIMHPLHTPA